MSPARIESGSGHVSAPLRTVRSFTSAITSTITRSRTNTLNRSRVNTGVSRPPSLSPLTPYGLDMSSVASPAELAQRAASPSYQEHRQDPVLPPDAMYVSVSPADLKKLSKDGKRLSLDGRRMNMDGQPVSWNGQRINSGASTSNTATSQEAALSEPVRETDAGIAFEDDGTPTTLPPAYIDYRDTSTEASSVQQRPAKGH